MSPLIKDAISKREYCRGQIGQWHRTELITDEQLEVLDKTQAGHEAGPPYEGAPVLWPDLQHVVLSWRLFGDPVHAFGGMATGINDSRPTLFPARLALLDECGVRSEFERGLYLRLWQALDETKVACVVERINTQQKEADAKRKAGKK